MKTKEINDPRIKAIMEAFGDEVGEHLEENDYGHYEMDLFEDDSGGGFAVGSPQDVSESGYMYIEQLVDDIGFEGFAAWVWEYIKENFVDESHFEDLLRDDMQYEIDQLREEEANDPDEFDSRLEEEMNEYGYEDEYEYMESQAADLLQAHAKPPLERQ